MQLGSTKRKKLQIIINLSKIDREYSPVLVALLKSSLFYWCYVISFDGRDLLLYHVENFLLELASVSTKEAEDLRALNLDLIRDYVKNSNMRVNVRKGENMQLK
jgi:hypothetical protein